MIEKLIIGIWAIFAPNQPLPQLPVVMHDQVLWVEIRHWDTVDNNGKFYSEIILHDGPCRSQRVISFPITWKRFITHNKDGSYDIGWVDINGFRITQALSVIETWESMPTYDDEDYLPEEGYSLRQLSRIKTVEE